MLPDLREQIEQEFSDHYDSFDRDSLKGIRIGVPQVCLWCISSLALVVANAPRVVGIPS